MSEEQTKPAENQLPNNQKQIKDELDFNAHAISHASDDFIKKLTKANSTLQNLLKSFNDSAELQEKTIDKISTEVRLLSLIPEKVQNRIDSIVPEIAKQIDLIYGEKANELNKEFENLQIKLNDDLNEHSKKISEVTEKFVGTTEQKLNNFTNVFVKKANESAIAKRNNFLKNTIILITFSGVISAITSYMTGTYFPRFVQVTGAHEISVNNSNVRVDGKLIEKVISN